MSRHPVVIIGMEGGVAQWEMSAPGIGMPRVFMLDFDTDGAEVDELEYTLERIEAAIAELEEHDLPDVEETFENEGVATQKGLATLLETRDEYKVKIAELIAEIESYEHE